MSTDGMKAGAMSPMTISQRTDPMAMHGMVTSPHYLASQAGRDILRRGGLCFLYQKDGVGHKRAYHRKPPHEVNFRQYSIFADFLQAETSVKNVQKASVKFGD